MQETWVWSLGSEDPLEKEMETYSSILAWKIPWTVGGLQAMGFQRDGHDWATKTRLTQTHYVQSKTQILKISLYLSCLLLKFPKQSAFLYTPYFVESPTITWCFKLKNKTHISACSNHNLYAILYPVFFTFPFLTIEIMLTPTVLTFLLFLLILPSIFSKWFLFLPASIFWTIFDFYSLTGSYLISSSFKW